MDSRVKNKYGICKLLMIALIMVIGGFVSAGFAGPQSAYADTSSQSETWIYVNGRSGSDSSDGSSQDAAVKTWDKATELLGMSPGGIIVCDRIYYDSGNHVITTPNPSKQVVKRDGEDYQIFFVSGNANVSFRDVVFVGTQASTFEAIMFSGGTINIDEGTEFRNFEQIASGRSAVIQMQGNTSVLNIYGGKFIGNKASSYGAVVSQIDKGTINIYAGRFENNEVANSCGGAIYQAVEGSEMNIYNAVFTGNKAAYGGAISACPTGDAFQFKVNGGAFYDNTADSLNNGYDIFVEKGTQGQGSVQLEDLMLGGGKHDWYGYAETSRGKGYDADPKAADKAKAEAVASTFFINNNAKTYGGAIRANGVLNIGTNNAALLFKKVDKSTHKPAAGAKFRLSGGSYDETVTDTDGSGVFVFKEIKAGSYTLTEITTPAGYEAVGSSWTVTVDPNFNISLSGTGVVQRSTATDMYFLIENTPQEASLLDHLTVQKKLKGREWKDSDKFEFALIPQDNAPMPDNATDTDGIKHADIEISNADSSVGGDSYKDAAGFGSIKFTTSDLQKDGEGKPIDTEFVYHVRELMAVESGLDRIPGVTYDDTRYEYKVTVGLDASGSLTIKSRKLLDADGSEVSTGNGAKVAEFSNSYDASKTNYHMMADKSYSDNGLAVSPSDGAFTFNLKAIGTNASRTPMPAGTSGGIYTAANEGNRVEFKGSDGDGITFDYSELTKAEADGGYGFTHDELADGVDFEYEITEVIPADAENTGDGLFVRYTERPEGTARETYDGTHHTRKISVKLVTLSDNTEELQVASHGDDHKGDFYVDGNGSEVGHEDSEWHDAHHGAGGAPIFVNAIEDVIDIPCTKTWNDEDNSDKLRPDSITVRLFADGDEVDSHLLDDEGEWQHTFKDLPKYSAGNQINYTIKEDAVSEYETSISGDSDAGFMIVNTHRHVKEPKLDITKTSNVKKARVGDLVDYTITANNTGDADATNLMVIDNLPEGLDYVSDDMNGKVDGQQVAWDISVNAGESVVIMLTTRINRKAAGKIINSVYIEGVVKGIIEAEDAAEIAIVKGVYEDKVTDKKPGKKSGDPDGTKNTDNENAATGDSSRPDMLISIFATSAVIGILTALWMIRRRRRIS